MSFFKNIFGSKNKNEEQPNTDPAPKEEPKSERSGNEVSVNFAVTTVAVENLPFELMMNLALTDASTHTGYTWMWTITLASLENDELGLPVDEERKKLFSLMQQIIGRILKEAEIRIVGTSLHKGVYDIMFYAADKDTGSIGGTIAEMKDELEDKPGRFVRYNGNIDENWEKTAPYYSCFNK